VTNYLELRDFTIKRYKELLQTLTKKGFSFTQVGEYDANLTMRSDAKRFVILRQDVDRLPGSSLAFARIQKEMGVRSTFYFRSVSQSFNPEIIEAIVALGHEIGYHYEDLSLAAQKLKASTFALRATADREGGGRKALIDEETKGQRANNLEPETRNLKLALEAGIESFGRNLEMLRKYAAVRTICMHGRPMSRWDSRLLWKYYDCKDFGIELEPYFDLNMEYMLYLTDTGRRWNGSGVSIRDKAQSAEHRAQGSPSMRTSSLLRDTGSVHEINYQERGTQNSEPFVDWKVKPVAGSLINMTQESAEFQRRYTFRTTSDIIRAAEGGELPERMMMTFHPQRWTDQELPWVKELVWQNVKNVGKYFLIRLRD